MGIQEARCMHAGRCIQGRGNTRKGAQSKAHTHGMASRPSPMGYNAFHTNEKQYIGRKSMQSGPGRQAVWYIDSNAAGSWALS